MRFDFDKDHEDVRCRCGVEFPEQDVQQRVLPGQVCSPLCESVDPESLLLGPCVSVPGVQQRPVVRHTGRKQLIPSGVGLSCLLEELRHCWVKVAERVSATYICREGFQLPDAPWAPPFIAAQGWSWPTLAECKSALPTRAVWQR